MIPGVNGDLMNEIVSGLERLNKSFTAAGHQPIMAGKTGTAAFAALNVDPVIYSITADKKMFKLTGQMPNEKSSSLVHEWRMMTASGSVGADLFSVEQTNFLEDAGKYEVVAEPLKLLGTQRSVGSIVEMVADAGGYAPGFEPYKQAEVEAATQIARADELAAYEGADYYIAADGSIDAQLPLNAFNAFGNLKNPKAIRSYRGIQSIVRKGDQSSYGIPGDFIGFGNSTSVVFDNQQASLDQASLDKVGLSLANNAADVSSTEGHLTPAQASALRTSLLAFQRFDGYAKGTVTGPVADLARQDGSIGFMTGSGMLDLVGALMKNSVVQVPIPSQLGQGQAPNQPAAPTVTQAAGSTYLALNQTVMFAVQAVNIYGRSYPVYSAVVTVGAAGNSISLSIPQDAMVAEYHVFMTNPSGPATSDRVRFIGRIQAAQAGATVFKYVGAIRPGFETAVFMPKDESRAKCLSLGPILNRVEVNPFGLNKTIMWFAIKAIKVVFPRRFAIVDNCGFTSL